MCGKRAACCPWVTRSTDEVSRVPGRFCPDPWRWPPWPLVQSSCLSLELSPLGPASFIQHCARQGGGATLGSLDPLGCSVDPHGRLCHLPTLLLMDIQIVCNLILQFMKNATACLSMSRNVLPPDCSPESVPAPRAQGHWALRCCPARSARGCHGAPVTGGDAHMRASCPSSSPASKPLTLSLCFPWRRPALPALICVFLMASDVDHIFMCVSLTVFSSPHF